MITYREDRPLLDLQRAFVARQFGMFLHFNMATYQDREWGDPLGPVEAFNPTALDTDQWAAAAKSAGMTWGCLTTKHHDGFAIWRTKTMLGGKPVDSILKTPHKIDVVRAYVDSFRRAGLSVGLYFSILDLRHDIRHFNITREKIDLIKAQLTELLTGYGPIDIIIFDGWGAPWSRIPYDEVPFTEIYAHVKSLQPNCLISELNASEYPPGGLFYSDIKSFEQNAGQHLPAGSELPALSCVTLTDGWFWKESDKDAELKSAKQVVEEWLMPQNRQHCNLICNAAPNREGKLAPNIVARLEQIGKLWRSKPSDPQSPLKPSTPITTLNLLKGRPIRAIASGDTYGPDQMNDGNFHNSWYLPEGYAEGWVEVALPSGAAFNTLMFCEPVGRFRDYPACRVGRYRWEVKEQAGWRELAAGEGGNSVVVHTLPATTGSHLRLTLWARNPTPHLAEIGAYYEPARGA